MKQNSDHRREHREIDLSKPHIEGTEGYPPRPEIPKDEAIVLKKK